VPRRGTDYCLTLGIATAVLRAVIDENWDEATRLVKHVSDVYGGDALVFMIRIWADTCCAAKNRAHNPVGPVIPRWIAPGDEDTLRTADQVPPAERWAGQFIVARITGDRAIEDALINALPEDGHLVGEHVAALLQMTALAVTARKEAGHERPE
jgi:hypothetical protein